MHKLAYCLSLTGMLMAAPLTAQSGLEIVGGFTSTRLNISEEGVNYPSKVRSSFAAGISLGKLGGNGLRLTPQVLYSNRGGQVTVGAVVETVKLSYLEVPLLISQDFSGSSGITPFVFAGPALRYQLSCKAAFGNASSSVNTNCSNLTEDGSDPLKKFDLGLTGGVGVRQGRLSLTGRYGSSLLNLNNVEESNAKAHNQGFLFLLGVSF